MGYLKSQELAERMFSSSKELRVAEQLEADVIFRRKSEKLAKAIRQSNKETPVGIEKISDNSYLISAGTESKESLPMVLYRIGKNSKSTVFSPVKPDEVITPKNILVKGNSKNELSGTEKLAKDVSVAPGNAKNLEKISDNTIDNFLKPESILTDVPNSFLEKYPKVAVHGAAQSDIPSSVYVTTEQRNPLRGFNADVKKLDAPDSLGKNTDTTRFREKVRDIVKTENKGRLDRNLGDKSTTPKPSKTNSKAAPPKPSNTKEILEPAKVKTTQNTKSVKTQSDVIIVNEILHPGRPKIKDKPVLNSAVKQGQRDSSNTDIVSDVKSEHQHDPFLDDMIKHQQKTDAMSGPKQKLNPPEIKKKDTPDSILYDLLVKPVMQTKQKPDYGVVFVPYSSTPPDDILIPTTTSKPPVPQGAKVTRRNETSTRTGRGLKRRRHEFLGNTRQDSILGIYNRSEVIYGDKKVRRTERKDAKTVRDSSKRKDREILPKAKSGDIDILGGRKSETDIIPRNRKSQKEILPKPRPKKEVDILKPSKSSSKDIDFLGGGKSKKGKKSEFDGWF